MTGPRSIPPRDLPRVAWRRVLREVRRRTAPRQPRAIQIGASIQQIAEQIRARQTPRFFGLLPEQTALLARLDPEARRLTVGAADRIRAHRFDLLGSGETDLGDPVDWHTDFKSGHTWPLEHFTRLTLVDPHGGYDVKVPWELSRFHHGLRLGQAYLYTEDETYVRELVAQITGWIEANPYEFGVNWAGPMDVAIRAVNWLWAFYLTRESGALTTEFLALFLASLRQHGEYLLKHLEDGWPRTNHLIANLAGLSYLGVLLPEFPEAQGWKETGLARLWEEIERQVRPDGMAYEASTAYHRLVAEMALSVVGLCVVNYIEVPETVLARLRAMLDVIMAYTPPDGLSQPIGDADDGRFLPLSVHADPTRAANDHRHLLALGSLILEREMPEWAGYVDPAARGWSVAAGDQWQDAFWYFASDAAARLTDTLARTTPRPPETDPEGWVEVSPGMRVRARVLSKEPVTLSGVARTRGFEASGLFVMRDADLHLVVDAGDVGQDGAGGHAHNDTLSLTLHAYGQPFLIDPGSYLYTSNPKARNAFRSTAYHNTLQVDGEEINRIPEGELFRLSPDAQIVVHRWEAGEGHDLLDVSHDGYARLPMGVIHRRQVWFDRANRLWVLRDLVTSVGDGEDEHNLALRFHLAPLPVEMDTEEKVVQAGEKDGPYLAIFPLGAFPLDLSLEEGAYAPRYGITEQAPVARFAGRVRLPADLVVILYPCRTAVNLDAARISGVAALGDLLAESSHPGVSPGD